MSIRTAAAAALLLLACPGTARARPVPEGAVFTLAGGGAAGDGAAATSAPIEGPRGLAADASGNLFIADTANHRVRRVDRAGIIGTVAGNGAAGAWGDGGAAASAAVGSPNGLAVDSAGNLYVAEPWSNRVRKVSPAGVITTLTGDGIAGDSGDAGPAALARVRSPTAVAVDGGDNVYVADGGNHRIRRIDGAGNISTVAGNGVQGFLGDGGPATSASLDSPVGVAVDADGNLYIVDRGNQRIRRVDGSGIISTVAGNGTSGYSGDGGAATSASLSDPLGIAVDAEGSFYVADFWNHRVRKVDVSGIITTVAGSDRPRHSGDGGPATAAGIAYPVAVAVDRSGLLHVADVYSNRVRRVDGAGIITTIAGTGVFGFSGEGGPATSTSLLSPRSVAADRAGNVYVADRLSHQIRRVDGRGVITTIAGNGEAGNSGDGGPATAASLGEPMAVAVDGAGNVLFGDGGLVRRVATSGRISTVAGTGEGGYSGDGGPATSARLFFVSGLAVEASGAFLVADFENHRIRRVDPTGIITTVAGNGASGYAGDGGAATSASISCPTGVAADDSGNIFVADRCDNRVRRIDPSGIITTVAGSGARGYSGDGGPATSARLALPSAVEVDGNGNLYIADTANHRIRMVDAAGLIWTVAGDGTAGFAGDGRAATAARLAEPSELAVDGDGVLYVNDTVNCRVRMLLPGTDAVPAAFAFVDATGVEPETQVVSGAITISGIDRQAPISVTGGEYSIGGGGFTSGAGVVLEGAAVRVRVTSAPALSTSRAAVLTVGGVSGTFTVTTRAAGAGGGSPSGGGGGCSLSVGRGPGGAGGMELVVAVFAVALALGLRPRGPRRGGGRRGR